MIGGWRPTVGREVAEAGPQRDDERQDRRQAALEAARRAHTDQGQEEQAQVERPRVDEQSIESYRVSRRPNSLNQATSACS